MSGTADPSGKIARFQTMWRAVVISIGVLLLGAGIVFVSDIPKSVTYTHLDVYKRQGQHGDERHATSRRPGRQPRPGARTQIGHAREIGGGVHIAAQAGPRPDERNKAGGTV